MAFTVMRVTFSVERDIAQRTHFGQSAGSDPNLFPGPLADWRLPIRAGGA
jgi:hypothetical protein